MTNLLDHIDPLIVSGATLVAAVLIGLVVHWIGFAIAGRVVRHAVGDTGAVVVAKLRRPSRVLLPLVAILIVLPGLPLSAEAGEVILRAVSLALVGTTGWLLLALLGALAEAVAERYRIDVADNLLARQMRTRIQMFHRIIAVAVIAITIAIMLMTIPPVRELGVSLFASAGVAGLVVGLAARPALSNIIAGMQIALTEPIRIDDQVIVEGEWGWVEEITTTYVVVRIWDLRRLIVPLSYFMDRPFQNWTRRTADILGSVMLHVDYTVPFDEVRTALKRFIDESGLWDGKVWNLQVVDATERTVQLRALMSAKDAGTAWDLRCYVREKLIGFLQQRYPMALPRLRAELNQEGAVMPARGVET